MIMSIKCLFGHQWNGCKCEKCGKERDTEHKWNGCKCEICGKTRDEGHSYKTANEKCIEKCSICGKERIIEHKWNGCKCERCGEYLHHWDENGKCKVCGEIFAYELPKDKISADLEAVLKNHATIDNGMFNVKLLKDIIFNLKHNPSNKINYDEAIAVLHSIDAFIFTSFQLTKSGKFSEKEFLLSTYDLWTRGNALKRALNFSKSDMDKLTKRDWGICEVSFTLDLPNQKLPLKMVF